MSKSVNDHEFTFVSPHGTVVLIMGYSYDKLHDGGKIIQYEIKNKDDQQVATIPGDWLFVRLGDQCRIID